VEVHGGFFITEKAKKLPVRAVLTAMGESDILDKCVLGLNKCSESKPCPMHHQYKTIKYQLIGLFETKTIQQLADDTDGGDAYLNNTRR
jgi:DNA-binding IscR family transcriptional regulator